ncbi:MAG: peptidase U32 family protein [Bacteroidales bacterium]
MKRRSDFELLAPAGSYDSLEAAAQGGADAVYFGIGQLNMRARSSAHFKVDDLPRIVSVSQGHGMKSYLTVNTVIFNHELNRMREIIDRAVEHGVTAIIASDQSVLQYCNSVGAKVHLSTQLNISNIETLKFYSNFADVAVLARELDLVQVKEISDALLLEEIKGRSGDPFRIEMFVHGALCMATSGKCYLSLHEHNHSANRGDCFQVCRRGYRVTDKDREVELDIDNEYIMSPKDLKTIHFLNKVLDAGVTILKIEGRARSADYVKTVTSCYDEAIHAYLDGSFSAEKIEAWDARLATVFNRGFWDGYYLGQRLGEWSEVYGSKATLKKVYLGKAINYFDRIGVAEVALETGTLQIGDDILITGPTTGVIETRVRELRVNEVNVEVAVKGDRFSFPVGQVVRRSDKVYKLVSTS